MATLICLAILAIAMLAIAFLTTEIEQHDKTITDLHKQMQDLQFEALTAYTNATEWQNFANTCQQHAEMWHAYSDNWMLTATDQTSRARAAEQNASYLEHELTDAKKQIGALGWEIANVNHKLTEATTAKANLEITMQATNNRNAYYAGLLRQQNQRGYIAIQAHQQHVFINCN